MPHDRFVKHAHLMSGLTLISRAAGLLRDKFWSAYLALGPAFSAFTMGFQCPNLFRRIFGEGALTAIFVPIYTRTLSEKGPDAANRLAGATTTFLILVLGGITLIGEACLLPPAFSPSVTPNNALTALMLAIMLPYCLLICLVALFGAIASVHERFAAQSLAPIVLNLLATAAAVLPVLLFTRGYPLHKRVVWVAFAVIIAGALQLLLMLPTLRKCGVRLPLTFRFKAAGLGAVLRPLMPMIVGLSAVQLNTFMDGQIAYWLSSDAHDNHRAVQILGHLIALPLGSGALAKLFVAQRLYMLPLGIFGVAMATAIFPMMSRAAAANDIPEVKRLLVAGLRKTLFLSLPTSFGMIIIARLLITVIYSGPRVSASDIDRADWAAIWFCAGIWCFESQMIVLRAYYALGDTRTPMRVAVAAVALNFSLNITLVWFMQEGGLALSTSLSALTQCAILLLILRRRIGSLGLRKTPAPLPTIPEADAPPTASRHGGFIATLALSFLAAVVMAEVGLVVRGIRLPWELPGMPADSRARILTALVKLPLVVVSCAAVYFALAWFLDIGELNDLPLVGRFFRTRPHRARTQT